MNGVEIGAIAAAIAFVVMAVYAVVTLHTFRQFLRKTDQTLTHVSDQADETMRLSRQLMRGMRGMLDDVQAKSRKLDGVYEAVVDFGEAVAGAASSVRRATSTLQRWFSEGEPAVKKKPPRSENGNGQKDQPPEWVHVGMRLWKAWLEGLCKHGDEPGPRQNEKE